MNKPTFPGSVVPRAKMTAMAGQPDKFSEVATPRVAARAVSRTVKSLPILLMDSPTAGMLLLKAERIVLRNVFGGTPLDWGRGVAKVRGRRGRMRYRREAFMAGVGTDDFEIFFWYGWEVEMNGLSCKEKRRCGY